jgi:hypothetical protein
MPMRSRTHRPHTLPLVAAAVLTLATATACSPTPDSIEPTSEPSVAPPFETDDEALSAAEKAYASYQELEDTISAEGGADPDRIRAVASRDALQAALDGFAAFQTNQLHAVGVTATYGWKLQQHVRDPSVQEDVVVAYVCIDYTSTDLLNAANESVVNEGGTLKQPYQVSFDSIPTEPRLIVASREPWSGTEPCE